MITPLVRFSYANVFEPKANMSGVLKYSITLLIPKTDTKAINELKAVIDSAVERGTATNKFNAAVSKSSKFKYPLHDGDQYYEEAPDAAKKAARESFRGNMFISASCDSAPGVVDRFNKPIIDTDEFYSGCWGFADVNFYPFNKNGGIGVGCGLNNLMKKRDDARLDGRKDAQTAFAGVADDVNGTDDNSDLQ